MSLIKCKECGEEISNKADKCPKCGIEIKKTSTFTWVVCAIIFFWFIGKLGSNSGSYDNSTTSSTNKIDYESLPEVTPSDLVWAYKANTVAADSAYKGRYFRVTGKVVSINTDFTGSPYLVMEGTKDGFSNPQFKFDKKYSSRLANIWEGATVYIACKGNGDIAKTPMLDSCVMLK